ncbi:MAG: glycosyltransferase [Thermoanaerobaculia bacterium]|nr:glycosyltransferase [Thermoanaerobaculia bacterium]
MRVARGEGIGSVARRAADRIEEGARLQWRLVRGLFTRGGRAQLLNVLATPPSSRLGGLQIQLLARLREEHAMREVALLHPGVLEIASTAWRSPSFGIPLESAIANGLERTGARGIVIEGMAGFDAASLLRFENVILSLHDLSLLDDPGAQKLMNHARAAIFPSAFLRDRHRAQLDLSQVATHVIEPGVRGRSIARSGARRAIAYAGSVKRHKGGHLLPEIIASMPLAVWHLFGGGDEELLRPLHDLPGVTVHGYYRDGTLPSLLARHDIGLALLPSIVPESYSLTLSECWRAGVPAVTFDHGAHAERIARDGGGWLVPRAEGAAGFAAIVRRWLAGEITTNVPTNIATPHYAAAAHLAVYRELGLLES